jgi:hypothetical protein
MRYTLLLPVAVLCLTGCVAEVPGPGPVVVQQSRPVVVERPAVVERPVVVVRP